MNRRLGVLVSGRGSNLQALIDATKAGRLDASVVIVISNIEQAGGLDRARAAGIEAICVSHRGWATREEHDRAIARELKARDVRLICLAGYMRRITPALIDEFPNAIVNIHPSLLPAFPGVNAQAQAIAYGVRVSGVTVHLVTAELDDGPIIVQRPVPVLDTDTPDTLSARILVEEHRVYPEAVQTVLDGRWRLDGRRFVRL